MAKRTHRASWLAAAALLAASLGHGQEPEVKVAVLALPSENTGATGSATHQLARGLASALETAGFRVVLAGTPTPAPLEQLTAVANAAGVDLALGVRSLGGSKVCPALYTPKAISRPVQGRSGVGQAQLAAYLKQLTAAFRYEASARLAGSLESVAQWCHPRQAEADAFVLENIMAPVVVLALPVGDGQTIAVRMPELVQQWVTTERSQK